MATKRDRKTAFPFIKPKGSIKKDVQQFRISQSKNADDSEKAESVANQNPVQRRESSASRFLKHFRPDRSNPAYHSEGKGLRKKRQPWTSERELPQLDDRKAPAISSKDRSRSFSEQDAVLQSKVTPNGKENLGKEGGGRESFRWRFRKSDKSSSKSRLEAAAAAAAPPGDEMDNTSLIRGSSLVSDGGDVMASSQQKSQTTQMQIDSGSCCSSSPSLSLSGQDKEKESGDKVGEGKEDKDAAAAAAEPVYCNTISSRSSSSVAALEADYVNFEVAASLNNKPGEPDLLQNLPSNAEADQSVGWRLKSSPNVLGRSLSVNNPAASANQSLQKLHISSESVFEDPADIPYGNGGDSRAYRPSAMHYGFTRSTPNLDSAAGPPKMAAPWDWSNGAAADEEMNYASQLRSSMATVLGNHSHMRQASTNSTSSNFSSYSSEDPFSPGFHDAGQNVPGGRTRFSMENTSSSNHPSLDTGLCSSLSGSSYEAFHQDLDLYCKQYGGWMDADSIGIPPPPPPASLSPPPPPVRDSSSLKYIKYGPGHEKHPSWPMPRCTGPQPQGHSQRSKSWTEQADYPKEPSNSYVRSHSKRLNPVFNQQLKTVLENCERIPAESFQPKSLDNFSSANFLPNFDCDGHNIDDKDYNIPSPPERDVATLGSDGDYARYDDIQQYSNSEGYCSYVPSESSYVSVSGTPLLDQLRRDTDVQVVREKEKEAKETANHTGRDSVTTVVTNSSSNSNSSNETLRWHGSYSDISVMSGSSSRLDSNNAIVVHSAKVQAPQRHHSESVLYYAPENPKSRPSFNTRNERSNPWNNQSAKRSDVRNIHLSEEQELFSVVDTSQPPSVQERIHQLERQSKSVPNLAERWRSSATDKNQQQQRSRQNLSLANGGQSINVDKEEFPKVNYTFLDPEKRHKVADPTLKAIQRQALMSYYERHTKGNSSADGSGNGSTIGEPTSPPPPLRTSPDSSKNETLMATRAISTSSNSTVAALSSADGTLPVKAETAPQPIGLVPPERPPKKPHMRPRNPAPISPDSELRRIEASAKELINLNQSRTSPRRKPPAPDPPPSPTPPSPAPALSPPSPRVAVSMATAPLVAEVSKPLVRKSSVQSRDNPVSAEASTRVPTPDLPPPPPPPSPPAQNQGEEANVPDEPLPPPPSPLAVDSPALDTAATSPVSPKSPMYHKESYMLHRKNMGLLHRHSSDNLLSLAEPAASPTSWEQQHNIRKGGTDTTLVFSSEDLRSEAQPKSFISQVTFQTELSVPLPLVEQQTPLVHTYRAVTQPNAERFAYLRKISNGDWNKTPKEAPQSSHEAPEAPHSPLKNLHGSHGPPETFQGSGKVSQGPQSLGEPPVPLKEAEKSREEQPAVIRNTVVTQTKISTLPRPKRPEEVECEQLSKDLISHLSPSDKLRALLRVPGPDHPTTARIVEGLFEQTETSQGGHIGTTPTSTPTTSPSKIDNCVHLPLNSVYFTTSEPKAKLLARYGSDIISEQTKEPVNSDLLLKKKEDLMIRLGKKLEVLRSERLLVQEEVEANEALGRVVASRVAAVATAPETNKVALHVAEVDKITALLLALAGRLARAQNALLSLPPDADPHEKSVLESKRDKLVEQLDEAKRLKENIDRRSVQVAGLLSKYLGEEEFADYTHFVTMKAKLVMDAKEIDEKIKLGEEQLSALRETLYVRPKV